MLDEAGLPDLFGSPFGVRDTGSDELVLDSDSRIGVNVDEQAVELGTVVCRKVGHGSLSVPDSKVN